MEKMVMKQTVTHKLDLIKNRTLYDKEEVRNIKICTYVYTASYEIHIE